MKDDVAFWALLVIANTHFSNGQIFIGLAWLAGAVLVLARSRL